MPEERFLSTNEASACLRIRLDQVYRLARGGAFSGAVRRDGRWAIPESAIRERIERIARRRSHKNKGSQFAAGSPETTGNSNDQSHRTTQEVCCQR